MTIAQNNLVIFHIDSIDKAVTDLSLRGGVIHRIVVSNEDTPPKIELVYPIEGFETFEAEKNGKKIHYFEHKDCLVYWADQ